MIIITSLLHPCISNVEHSYKLETNHSECRRENILQKKKDNLRELVLKNEDIIDNKKTNTCYIDKKNGLRFISLPIAYHIFISVKF